MNAHTKPLIAVLGTGIIGAPVVHNLRKQGFIIQLWNRTATKAQALVGAGISAYDHPAEAVQNADIIITLLKDGPSVTQAMQMAASELNKGAIWLQLSTVGIAAIDSLATLARHHGLVFYDAPIQGTRQPAEMAQLVVLASGPVEQRNRVQPIFDAIGKRTLWVSECVGTSSRLKLALNSWVFALTHGIAESLALAEALGIPPELVVDVITDGPMDSGYFQAKAAAMLAHDYHPSFSLNNAVKDTKLLVAAAAHVGLQMDSAQAGLERFERAQKKGHGDKDIAASYLA